MSDPHKGGGGTRAPPHQTPPSKEPSWNDIMDDQSSAPLTVAAGMDGASALASTAGMAETAGHTHTGAVRKSWASVLGRSLPARDNKNVLEITLEKDTRGSFVVTESECANMMRKLGLDQRPGIHVEGVQICPQGRGVIFITLKKEVDIGRFCRYEVLEVTQSGIRSVLVKPAGKREVIVTAKGIHPNTREDVVIDYLGKFGKVFTSKVVYGVFNEGPLKGIRNGDRSYKMEIKPGSNLGSYHVIDGQKVTLRYPGQQQTCARCHQTPQSCKGKGVARRCEAEGGLKIEFTDYILGLWRKIGYSPDNLDLSEISKGDPDSISLQDGGNFTPNKSHVPDTAKYTGVSIKQFPRETDHGKIIEFLVNCGLPESQKDKISITNKGTATIKDLENGVCLALIEAIHAKKNFDKKLFCNGIVPLTPEKPAVQLEETPQAGKPLPPANPKSPGSSDNPLESSNLNKSPEFNGTQAQQFEKPLPPSDSEFSASKTSKFLEIFNSYSSRTDLVRRNSLSLFDRSPPPKSLAAEILGTQSSSLTLKTSKSILSSIADIQDSLSDFNSCVDSTSELSSSSDEAEDNPEKDNFKTANQKKREKKLKRKLALTPGKEQFLKKQNTQHSPQ